MPAKKPAKNKTPLVKVSAKPAPALTGDSLLAEVRDLIASARQTVARGVNAALVLLYWQVGHRIRRDILNNQRAEYGAEILPTLSAKLIPEFGQGFSARNLSRMMAFTYTAPFTKSDRDQDYATVWSKLDAREKS